MYYCIISVSYHHRRVYTENGIQGYYTVIVVWANYFVMVHSLTV